MGGGPTDPFRFVGDFTIAQVPEPSVFTLLGTFQGQAHNSIELLCVTNANWRILSRF